MIQLILFKISFQISISQTFKALFGYLCNDFTVHKKTRKIISGFNQIYKILSLMFYSTTTSGFATPITPHASRDPAAPVG